MALKFRQAFTLGGNSVNCYHPVRAPPRDKHSFNLRCVDNTSLLIHYCSILYSNAPKMHCFTCSSVVTIYGVSAKSKCLAKFECHFFGPPLFEVQAQHSIPHSAMAMYLHKAQPWAFASHSQ